MKIPNLYRYDADVRFIELYEEKSISDNVKNLTSAISSAISGDLEKNTQIWYETVTIRGMNYKMPYKYRDRGLSVNLLPIFGIDSNVQIKYKVYMISKKEYDYPLLSRFARWESDGESSFENGWIRVTTYAEDGVLSEEFVPSIQHEASHYFQSFMGQKYNTSLYDGARNLSKSTNKLRKNIGLSLYYAFPVEQDAFTNQFYAWLMNRQSTTQSMSTFELAKPYSIYPLFDNSAKYVDESDPKDVEKILAEIGMPLSQYWRYINKADRRLQKKLRHAFDKYLIDKKKGNLSERVFTAEELNDKQVFADNFLTDKHRDFSWNS